MATLCKRLRVPALVRDCLNISRTARHRKAEARGTNGFAAHRLLHIWTSRYQGPPLGLAALQCAPLLLLFSSLAAEWGSLGTAIATFGDCLPKTEEFQSNQGDGSFPSQDKKRAGYANYCAQGFRSTSKDLLYFKSCRSMRSRHIVAAIFTCPASRTPFCAHTAACLAISSCPCSISFPRSLESATSRRAGPMEVPSASAARSRCLCFAFFSTGRRHVPPFGVLSQAQATGSCRLFGPGCPRASSNHATSHLSYSVNTLSGRCHLWASASRQLCRTSGSFGRGSSNCSR